MSNVDNADLQGLARQLACCTKCELSESRECTIPGYGPGSAQIMIVGAAVPFYLASKGRPLLGTTGDTVSRLLSDFNVDEGRVYLTNTVKCPLPRQDATSQDPSRAQIQACAYWLNEEIRLVRPRLIITLGLPALQRFFPGHSVSSFQKQAPREEEGILYFSLHHPRNFHSAGCGPYASWEIEPLKKLQELCQEFGTSSWS